MVGSKQKNSTCLLTSGLANKLVRKDPMTSAIFDFCGYNRIKVDFKPRFIKWRSVILVLFHIDRPPFTDSTVSFCVYSTKVAVNKGHFVN